MGNRIFVLSQLHATFLRHIGVPNCTEFVAFTPIRERCFVREAQADAEEHPQVVDRARQIPRWIELVGGFVVSVRGVLVTPYQRPLFAVLDMIDPGVGV